MQFSANCYCISYKFLTPVAGNKIKELILVVLRKKIQRGPENVVTSALVLNFDGNVFVFLLSTTITENVADFFLYIFFPFCLHCNFEQLQIPSGEQKSNCCTVFSINFSAPLCSYRM